MKMASSKDIIKEVERLGRQRKFDPTDSLQAAVVNFVNKRGGSAVVVGGISVEHSGGLNYHVRIKCTGRPPKAET